MWIALGIIFAVTLILLAYIISIYNLLISLSNSMEEAFATMDVYLKKRWDLVPNLVSITKGYVSHERETLEAVIKARNVSVNSHNKDERIQGETALGLGLKNLFALAENYPDLKADKSFLNLQDLCKIKSI